MSFTPMMSPVPYIPRNEAGIGNGAFQQAMKTYKDLNRVKTDRRAIEADLFHKTISPLANLAVSPVFGMLSPQQQQQISQYIGQGLQSIGAGGPQGQPLQGQDNGLMGKIQAMFGGQQQQQQGGGIDYGMGDISYANDNANAWRNRSTEKLTGEQIAPNTVYGAGENKRISPSGKTREQLSNLSANQDRLADSWSNLKNTLKSQGLINSKLTRAQGLSKVPLIGTAIDMFQPRDVLQSQNNFAESLAATGLYTLQDAQRIAQRGPTESDSEYLNRLKKETGNAQKQKKRLSEQVSEHIPLKGKSKSSIDLSHLSEDELVAIAGQDNMARE